MRFFCVLWLICVSSAALAAPATTAIDSAIIARTNTTIIGQKNEVPKNPTVVVTSMVFAPGARTPVHKHLYPHYALVQDGTLTIVNTQSGKSFEVKSGTFFLEMIDTWHYGINKGAVPVRLLITDLIPEGVKANSVLKDPAAAGPNAP